MTDQDTDVQSALIALLSEKNNGAGLPEKLIQALVTYFIRELEVTTLSDLPADEDEWFATVTEAWQAGDPDKRVPALVMTRFAKWKGFTWAPSSGLAPNTSKPDADSKTKSAKGTKSKAKKDESECEGCDDDEEDLVVREHDKAQMAADLAAQRISGERMVGSSFSLEMGYVVALADIGTPLIYGSNPKLSSVARGARKAGCDTLGSIIESQSLPKLTSHMAGVMRDYTRRGMTEEAALLSGMWSEIQVHYAGNAKGLFAYLAEWCKVYKGRGIPTPFDEKLAMRLHGFDGGKSGGEEEIKQLKRELKEARDEARRAQEKSARDLREIRSLISDGGGAKGNKTKGDKFCDFCKKAGHNTDTCWTKKKADKAKEEGEAEEE